MAEFTLRELEAFVATAEYSNFTQAGEALHLAQSTVSAHVQALENALGTALLIRGARTRLCLTEDGQRVYASAKDILSRTESLQRMCFTEQEQVISLASSTVPAVSLVPGLVGSFVKKHRGTCYFLKRGDSERVQSMLDKGEAHIGFIGETPDVGRYRAKAVATDTLVLLTANTEKYRSLQKAGTPAEKLLPLPLFFREDGSATQKAAERYLSAIGIQLQALPVVARVDNPETILRGVADGIGAAILSSVAAARFIETGEVLSFSFSGGGPVRSIYILSRKDTVLNKAESAFWRYVTVSAALKT